ncbi:hypothetical protein ES703_12032 [subsurface metagenome]
MPRKKKRKKQPTLRSLIVSLIVEEGPRKLSGMTRILGSSYQSLNSEALKLRRLGVLEKDADGVLSLAPGVDPVAFGIELITSDPAALTLTQPESPRTLEHEFRDVLISVGVKKGAQVIAELFFAGDIWNMRRLHRVLLDDARGFVTEAQGKLIMGYWAYTKGVPYEYEDFFED